MNDKCDVKFPSAPIYKDIWPWKESENRVSLQNCELPRITIITPSFNQGQFLEETIRSVLLQRYPNLEYFVIDGGSTDQSVDLIRKYDPWITWWVSEPDQGQSHAINKGLEQCTGKLVGWINSDDVLLPGALENLALFHQLYPNSILAGKVIQIRYEEIIGEWIQDEMITQKGLTFENFVEFWTHSLSWHQPGIYFPRSVFQSIGTLDVNLRYGFDHDMMCRALQFASITYLDRPIACFRLHSESKTGRYGDLFLSEIFEVSKRYWSKLPTEKAREASRFSSKELSIHGLRLLRKKRSNGLNYIIKGLKTNPSGVSDAIWMYIMRIANGKIDA